MARYKSPNGTGRVGRDKKKKALQSDEYKGDIEKLEEKGITLEIIQMIYDRCQQRPQTKITRHTLASKLVNLLEYFDERNKGMEESSKEFISIDDTIEMIMKNPRIITNSISDNIVIKCQVLDEKKKSVREANILIKSNPGLFRKTVKSIIEGR